MNMTLGAVGYNAMSKSVAVSGYYTTMIAKENNDAYYINTWLKSPQALLLYKTYATGSLIEKQRVQFPTLSIIPASFPSFAEQQKIGKYFEELDNLITLHQRKCDETKELKKYMLQKMFPKNGEKKPEIRFSGFTDDWEQRKFPEFVEFYNGLTYSPDDVRKSGTLVLRSSNVKNGEIIDADNVYVDPEKATSENVKDGDIIVVVRNGSRALIGKHAEIKGNKPDTVIGAFMSGIRSEHSSFVNALLDTSQFEKEIEKNMGATINQITGYMFSKMEFMIPSSKEQEVIGKYFKSLDNLITLHRRMYCLVYRIVYVRTSFSTLSWEQRKLSECAGFRRGSFPQPYGNKEWYDGEEAMPFVQVADVADDMKLVDDTKQKISKLAQPMSVFADKGSVLVTLQGSIGRVAITQYGAFVDRTVLIFDRYNQDIDKTFWAYIIKEKFIDEARKAPGGTIKTITKEALSDFDLMLPCFDEQKKLGAFLVSIDNLITLHQRKCDELVELKKYMLQNMFPQKG